jgi:hypothetical protein
MIICLEGKRFSPRHHDSCSCGFFCLAGGRASRVTHPPTPAPARMMIEASQACNLLGKSERKAARHSERTRINARACINEISGILLATGPISAQK